MSRTRDSKSYPVSLEVRATKKQKQFQGSLYYLFGRDQTMQMSGTFGDFPYNSALLGLVIQ